MNAPQFEYTTTADGVRIAFARSGSGPPLVFAPGMGTTVALVTANPEIATSYALFFARLSRTHTVIR